MNATQSFLSIFSSIDTEKLIDDLTDLYLGVAAIARILYTMTIVLVQLILWLYDRGTEIYDRVTLGDEPTPTFALAGIKTESMVTVGLRSVQAKKALPIAEPVLEVAEIAPTPKSKRKPRAETKPSTPSTPKAKTQRKPRATKTPKA